MRKKYEKYIKSGVNWINEFPSSWELVKFKRFAKIRNGKDQKEVAVDEGGYPILGTGGEFGRSSQFIHDKPSVLLGRKGTINKPQFIQVPFWTVDTLFYTDINNDVNPKYLFYLSQQIPFDLLQESSAVPSMTQEKLNSVYLVKPSLIEQTKIAQYLDHQTALIDQLIQQKEKLIELLKEKRQAIINEVVTKGLNPHAKMKDSGIEWLGEIPNHWAFMPLKYLASKDRGIQTGPFGTQLNTKDYTENGIKVLNQKTLIEEDYDSGEEYISSEKMKELNGFEVIGGDIILGTRGSFGTKNRTTFGKCSIVPDNIQESVLHPCLIRIRLSEDLITKNYFKYYVNDSTHFLEHLLNTSNSTTIEVIYGVTLKSIKFPVPPISEQNKIVQYLDKKADELDKIISLETTQIDKLKEYRQSIISEAVTGKIDVREWKPNKQHLA